MKQKPAQITDAAWCPLGRLYRDAVAGSTEASDNYHLGVFITVAGALLGRSVYYCMPHPLYPNFYTALTGASSRARKGTAMGFGNKLLRAVAEDEICMMYGLGSAEGFVDQLSQFQASKKASSVTMLIELSELRTLIDKMNQKSTSNITGILSEAFDCKDKLHIPTRHHREVAENPFTSILGGAAPDWLEKIQALDLKGGIGNRFLWVPGEPKEANPKPPPVNSQFWKPLISELRKVRSYWTEKKRPTEFELSSEADAKWEQVYKRTYNYGNEDPLVSVLSDRMEVHTIKVALLYAALDRKSVIELGHLSAAIEFSGFLMDSLFRIFSDYGISQIVKDERKIRELIDAAGPNGIKRRLLQQRLSRMDSETFSRRLKWMLAEGIIRQEINGRSIYLVMNISPEEEDAPLATTAQKDAAQPCPLCSHPLRAHDEKGVCKDCLRQEPWMRDVMIQKGYYCGSTVPSAESAPADVPAPEVENAVA